MSNSEYHNRKGLTDIEMVMLGDVIRFFELTATKTGRTLQEDMDILMAEGDAVANSSDMVGGMIVVAEIVATLLERGEPLTNVRNYADKSTKFGKALLAALDHDEHMLDMLARDVCAHVLLAGGCMTCFRLEMRAYLYEGMDIEKSILKIADGTAAMLSLIMSMGSEADVMSWGSALLARYEQIGMKYNVRKDVRPIIDRGRDMGNDFMAKMNDKGQSPGTAMIGSAVGRITALMLLVNRGLLERGAIDYLMSGDDDADMESQQITDALTKNMGESSIDFLNKIGEKLDD